MRLPTSPTNARKRYVKLEANVQHHVASGEVTDQEVAWMVSEAATLLLGALVGIWATLRDEEGL